MYYSRGNFEAFARPRKPTGVDDKIAWIVGSGLAGLSTAAFLVRDAQMPGKNITILEELDVAGGALDGKHIPDEGFVTRGGREMEEHFECLWDLFRSVPSLDSDVPGASVLDEFYWLNKEDPNSSLCRATVDQGKDSGCRKTFTLSARAQLDLVRMFLASRKSLEGKRINEVMSAEFLASNFWMYWRTMFAFQEWHSALEMKLYLHRFINHVGSMPDFSTLKFTRYNQYDSLTVPLEKWLRDQGVKFQYGTEVQDIDFAMKEGRKQATYIHWIANEKEGGVALGEGDLVFTTIGSLTENSEMGSQHKPAALNTDRAPAWELWRRIAAQDTAFGRPDVFCSNIPQTKWMSATVTMPDERIPAYIRKVCGRDPFDTGHVTTGGIVTVQDSSWLMSWTTHRQPHFRAQPKGTVVSWIYGLLVEKPGDFVKKPMQECTGEEIVQEWLYHLGVPVDEIAELAGSVKCVPCMMPYVTSFFMPRHAGDRPDVVPAGAVNFAFIGQFAETTRDCIFTTEYSVRTGMEAVYQLLGVERGVPEVFASTYDLRCLLNAAFVMQDGRTPGAWIPEMVRHYVWDKVWNSWIGELLHEAGSV